MTEKVTKQYFCDFCGKEIDSKSESAIRCFDRSPRDKDGFAIRQLPQLVDATRQVYVIVTDGDFCDIVHFAQHIKRQMEKSRGRPVNDEAVVCLRNSPSIL